MTNDTGQRAWVNLCKSGQPLRLGGSRRVVFGFLSVETAQSHRIYSCLCIDFWYGCPDLPRKNEGASLWKKSYFVYWDWL